MWPLMQPPGMDMIHSPLHKCYSLNHKNPTTRTQHRQSSSSEDDDDDTENDTATHHNTTQSMFMRLIYNLPLVKIRPNDYPLFYHPHIMSNHVQIWHTSHETLSMVTNHYNNVALIVYNLGFLTR